MNPVLEVLHHVLSNDHGELTVLLAFFSDQWAFVRARLGM